MRNLQPVRLLRRSRTGRCRVLGLGLLLACAALGLDRPALSAGAADPVEDLRNALREYSRLDRDPETKKDQLAYRQRHLEKKAEAVQTIGDLTRALLLLDWRDRDSDDDVLKTDLEVRTRLAERYLNGLRQAMKGKDPAVRQAAANLVSKTAINARLKSGSPKTGPGPGVMVRKFLRQLAPDLEKMSTEGVGQVGPGEAVRSAAAAALSNMEADPDTLDEDVMPALKQMLEKDTPACRRAAADALDNMLRILAQPELRNETLSAPLELRTALVNIGQRVVPLAAAHLLDPDLEVRRLCAGAIQRTATALAEEVPGVAARDLKEFPPPGRAPTMMELELLNAYAAQVREEHTAFLPLLRVFRDNLGKLVEAAASPRQDDRARILIFNALEELGIARDELEQRWQSVPREYRKPLPVEVKGVRAAPEDRLQLARLTEQDKDAALEDPLRRELEKAVDVLRRGLQADEPVRVAALEALEMLGPEAANAGIALNGALTDPSHLARRVAARALGKLRPPGAGNVVERLAWLLEFDPDLDVRLAAAGALERYGEDGGQAAAAAARTVAGRNDAEIRLAAMRALPSFGKRGAREGVKALGDALADPDARVRRAAVEALYRFGADAAAARDQLIRAVNDSDPEIGRVASEAVLQIPPPPEPLPAPKPVK